MSDQPNPQPDPRETIRSMVDDINLTMSADRGDCPYLLRWEGVEGAENATCGYGCREEPECVTCEPDGGWPSRNPDYDPAKAWTDEFTDYLLANFQVVPLDAGLFIVAAGEAIHPTTQQRCRMELEHWVQTWAEFRDEQQGTPLFRLVPLVPESEEDT